MYSNNGFASLAISPLKILNIKLDTIALDNWECMCNGKLELSFISNMILCFFYKVAVV